MNHCGNQGQVKTTELDQALVDVLYAISNTSRRIADNIKSSTGGNLRKE